MKCRLLYATCLTVGLSAFVSPASFSTTILSIRSDEGLFVAADSKLATIDGSDTRAICKIVVAPNFVFAAAGMLKESAGSFDVFDIAQRAITRGGSLDQVALAFETELKFALPAALAKLNRDKGADYYRSKVIGKPMVQAILAHAQNGRIEARYLGVVVGEPDGPVQIIRRHCPGDCPNPRGDFVEIGERGAIDRELARDPKFWRRLGVQRAFERLISLQADATPQTVGRPVAIVRMLRDGSLHWDKSGHCQ